MSLIKDLESLRYHITFSQGKETIDDAVETINRLQAQNEELARELRQTKYFYDSTKNEAHSYRLDIKKLKAEIDKYSQLQATLNMFWDVLLKCKIAKRKKYPTLEEFAEAIQEIRAEAKQEIVDALKDLPLFEVKPSHFAAVVTHEEIDNFLKEKVGEDNG